MAQPNINSQRKLALDPGAPVSGTALDIILLLSVAGSVGSIAALLWMAYDKFIAPKKSSEEDDGGIYMTIRRPDGTVVEFWLGNTHRHRDSFVEEFTEKVMTICREDDPDFWAKAVAEVEQSDRWLRQR